MQREGESMCVVEDGGVPVGIVTLDDILSGVIGRMKDSLPAGPEFSLREAIAAGAIVSSLAGRTPEQVITELVAAIPANRLPEGANIAELALAREREHSTDLGTGVAVPHARCAGLSRALVIVGRSLEGVLFSRSSDDDLVHLVFLFVTPLEQPRLQLDLLAQLARIAGDAEARDRLLNATTDFEILDILCEHSETARGSLR
jgi:mannitol/fructose-specific phosphotransferase system IIA component (Ntr-type)